MRFGLTLLLILFLAPQVGAQEALLELIQGRLKVQRGTQVRFLTNDDPDNPLRVELQKNTRVQTGANSQALVTLRRGEEVIQLRSNSLFSLDQLGEEETQIRMPVGKAQFRVDPNRRIKRRFVVRTPTAVVGVKGTEFVMGAGDGATSMLTLSGTVEMASAEAPKVQIAVSAGQASKLEVGSAPTPPVSVPPELQASIVESDSAETFTAVSFPPAQPIEEAAAQAEQEEAASEEPAATEDAAPAEEAPVEETTTEEPAVEEPAVETPLPEGLLDDISDQTDEAVNSVQETEKAVRLNIERANQQ